VPVHRIGRDAVAVVDPERGGKVLSLTGKDGRQWLAQSRDPARSPIRGDAVFTSSDPAGWDECAPSIDACEVSGAVIPDHGDLWTAPWTVVAAEPDSVELRVLGRSLGFSLTRRISATPDGLAFDYSASATGADVPFLWAAHPLFRSAPGTVIELPGTVGQVIDVIDPASPRVPWSPRLATTDNLRAGECRKIYVDPDTRMQSATLRHVDGAALTMTWRNCPYLGLWFDNQRFSHEPVVAIEPSLGYRDSLRWAVDHGTAPLLRNGESLTWSLAIAITGAT
jgi:galactose mutarotase-like enzyme